MTKRERQIVHDKYGGKCGYCGDPLVKGWHVDHIEPVRRFHIFDDGFWQNRITKEKRTREDIGQAHHDFDSTFEWIEPKKKTLMAHPENDTVGNYMPSCASCNINKHGQSIEGFREMIAYFIVTLNKNSTQYKIAKRYGLVTETIKPVGFYFEEFIDKAVSLEDSL